ncbi:DinB family protein [Spirosoma utsteinense]|uniref:Damage-inducible protein DinB n=1 Tax=Spirosoma utsteinense TaxID=2585773 RepID=A0ABR6W0Y5_9BACT|nr:DUF1572 family protein [Spirosoma utsteinense]MBC3783759.1 putative damage-inducible protein DinB [Spirosoma utsteinense]MBC3790097.1 putative damage-inducible protein DinB [Spirosoma utsteinense]
MLIQTLKILFRRDLNQLKRELEQYTDERILWHIEKSIANSAGNLCLHLIGNLNTYIGGELGQTGYVRNRELEFSQKNVSRAELLARIDDTILVVDSALDTVTSTQLEEEYPMLVFEKKTSTGYFLVHLSTHLGYHLGQINYHRRLLDS